MRTIGAAAFIVAAGISAAIPQIASAADLPPRPVPVAVAPVFNWTGCYIGGNIGWTSASVEFTGAAGASGTSSAFTGGLQIGCDYQTGLFVIGIRNLSNWTDVSGNTAFSSAPFAGFSGNLRLRWFDHLTVRFGYAMQPNWLLYVQGGAAWTRANLYVNNAAGVGVGQFSSTRTGWTLGVGAEYMFSPGWSAFLEYNFANYGSTSGTITGVGSVSARADTHSVLVGVNWRWSSGLWATPGRI